jgi:hypothetical protein
MLIIIIGKKEEKKLFFSNDLFLVADSDAKVIPPTVDHDSLGLRCDVTFKSNGSSKHVLRVFKK